jgi:hypothetical protein
MKAVADRLAVARSNLIERVSRRAKSRRPYQGRGRRAIDALERAGVKVHHVCHEHMLHHFYAMGGAIPYARTALKSVGDYIKTVLTPTNNLTVA